MVAQPNCWWWWWCNCALILPAAPPLYDPSIHQMSPVQGSWRSQSHATCFHSSSTRMRFHGRQGFSYLYEVHIADMICFCFFDVFIPGCRLFWLAIGLNSHALASMRSKGDNYKTEVFRSINEHGCPILPGKLALFGRELRVS